MMRIQTKVKSLKNDFRIFLESVRILVRALKTHLFGIKKYSGSVDDISRKILDSCYDSDKKYFMVSSGHFCQFYSRDFGMCCESLLNLGYKKEVRNTLIYAMGIFIKEGKITTHISPSGKAVDFPSSTPESAAYMLRSLLLLGDKNLLKKYKSFFSDLAETFFEEYVDKNTGLLRKDISFSSMKDHSVRVSDCYNNCMLGMFALDLKSLGVSSSLHKFDYKYLIKKYFWTGSYFLEDLSGRNVVSGDANTFPFWTGLFNDKDMFLKALKSMRNKGLDKPFPLKYTSKEDVPKSFHFANILVPGYEADTIWVHLGLCFMQVVGRYDSLLLKKYVSEYENNIKKHRNFLEVYFADGSVFKRPLYYCDESMSWVSIFLDLKLSLESV